MTGKPNEDWNPRSDEVLEDQIKAYDAMRHRCPVAWSDYQQWTLFRHEDVMTVLKDHDTFLNNVSQHLSVPNGMDLPEHTPYRNIIEPYFAPEPVAQFSPKCREIAVRLIATLPRDETVDVVHSFSRRYALYIQCAFMGWPENLHEPLAEWVQKNHRATLARDRDAMARVAEEFDGYIRDMLAIRRNGESPVPDDVTTSLMKETINGRPMTDEELVSLMRNWTVGELSTISASVSILLHYLAKKPDLFQQLKAQPEELPEAIDEILRIDAPLISNRRVTSREVTLGERTIPAGKKITILWASANRDEETFGNPDSYCPHANADKNLLYGAGLHVCPGARLARMELQVLMEELLARINQITPTPGRPATRAAFPTGGFLYLPLTFT